MLGRTRLQHWPNRDWGGKSVTPNTQLGFTIQSGIDGQEDKIRDGQFSSRKDLNQCCELWALTMDSTGGFKKSKVKKSLKIAV